jgi:DNA-binding MarR family transcriptional regulator
MFAISRSPCFAPAARRSPSRLLTRGLSEQADPASLSRHTAIACTPTTLAPTHKCALELPNEPRLFNNFRTLRYARNLQPSYYQKLAHSLAQAQNVTPAFPASSTLFPRSSAQERKLTPAFSIISALFREKVGVPPKIRSVYLQSQLLTVNNQYYILRPMPKQKQSLEDIPMPGLLRHARYTYGAAMRQALDDGGYDDVPKNGMYVIGGLALGLDIPLSHLIRELRLSKQAAGQLVDTLVTRGYLDRRIDEQDRRKLVVTLTERGKAAAAAQAAARKKIDAQLLAAVGQEDVKRTRRALAVLIDMGAPKKGARDDV